jgi:hypothetical protein
MLSPWQIASFAFLAESKAIMVCTTFWSFLRRVGFLIQFIAMIDVGLTWEHCSTLWRTEGFAVSRVTGTNSARALNERSSMVTSVPKHWRKLYLFLGRRSHWTLSWWSNSSMIKDSFAQRMLRQVIFSGLGSPSSVGSKARLAFAAISFSLSSMTLGESHFITTSLSFTSLLARTLAWSLERPSFAAPEYDFGWEEVVVAVGLGFLGWWCKHFLRIFRGWL